MAISESLGTAFVDIQVNLSQLNRGLSKAQAVVQRSTQKISRALKNVGRQLIIFATLPIAILGVQFIRVASDAEEMESKFNTVFRNASADVRAWSEEIAGSVNRSSIDIRSFAAELQDTFVPLGFARDEAAKLSKGLVELAIDVASFNNVSDADVIRDFQSALVGNTETVRKYGIVITQATLEQELINLGLADSVKNASEADKAFARFSLILASTTDAQGDAAKTAGTFANQLKGLQADFKDFSADIGSILLPIATALVESLRELVSGFKGLSTETKVTIIQVAAIVAVIGPLLLIGGLLVAALGAIATGLFTVAKAFALLLSPIGLAITAIVGLITLFVAFPETVKIAASTAAEAFKQGFVLIFQGFLNIIKSSLNLLIQGFDALAEFAGADFRIGFRFEIENLDEQKEKLATTFKEGFQDIKDTAKKEAKELVDSIGDAFAGLGEDLFQLLPESIRNALEKVKEAAKDIGKEIGEEIGEGVKEGVEETVKATEEALTNTQLIIRDTLQAIGDAVGDSIKNIVTGATSILEGLRNLALDIIDIILTQLIGALVQAGLSAAFPGLFPSAKGNVFSGGQPVPFQRGGLISGRTTFPMGLAGEAGPEAIFPLTRMPGGRNGDQGRNGRRSTSYCTTD